MILIKRFLYLLAWTVVVGHLFYWGMKWRYQLEQVANAEAKLLPIVLFSIIFPIIMGVLFRLPQLIIEIQNNKKWTFDWSKFIAIGLPTLLILIIYSISYLGIIPAIHLILISGSTLATTAGIVFGYILLDSLIE